MREIMDIKANGISINYQIDGKEGAAWLIFSNSLATDLTMWDQQAKDFSGALRVLRFDQRGHGKTEAPAGRYSFDMLIADALGLMDALKIDKANACGLSMGGATALGLAQRHPDRIARAIVCDSGCASTPQSAQQWEERIAVAQQGGLEALVEPTVTRWFPPDVVAKNPPYLDTVRAMIRTRRSTASSDVRRRFPITTSVLPLPQPNLRCCFLPARRMPEARCPPR